jgi:hypothetical protein
MEVVQFEREVYERIEVPLLSRPHPRAGWRLDARRSGPPQAFDLIDPEAKFEPGPDFLLSAGEDVDLVAQHAGLDEASSDRGIEGAKD